MEDSAPPFELLPLLNAAIARELQVSIQYMFQHSLIASRGSTSLPMESSQGRLAFFVNHSAQVSPREGLKAIAIAEMRHAEAIVERVAALGGQPTTEPASVTIGVTLEEMLKVDQEEERQAIRLYGRIIGTARRLGDRPTHALFKKIMAEEREHLAIFQTLLAEEDQ